MMMMWRRMGMQPRMVSARMHSTISKSLNSQAAAASTKVVNFNPDVKATQVEATVKDSQATKPAATHADKMHPTQATTDEMFNNTYLKERVIPIQLRNSGDNGGGGLNGEGSRLLIDTRVRKGPFWHLSQEAGAWCYQIYNKVYHPRAYFRPEEGGLMKEYEYLTNHVTMWNVAVERQVRVKGPDAVKFVNQVITRKAENCGVMKSRYVILCNYKGGILNDPIMLRPEEDEYWFSISDTDINMYLQGVQNGLKMDVIVDEIDVAPVQIQGPKSTMLMKKLVGEEIEKVPYYGLFAAEIGGAQTIISRTGWSTERGYEIYLKNATRDAEKLWYSVLEAGKEFNLRVIAPGHHRRIEAGIISYGGDIDIENNPYECGLEWMLDYTKDDFIGKDALLKIKEKGVTNKLAGIRINGGLPITWYTADFYHIRDEATDEIIGFVTSAWYSPAQKSNIALANLPVGKCEYGTKVKVVLPDVYADPNTGNVVSAEVCPTPFKKPDWEEYGTGLRTTGSKFG